jgi:hypothetical protein
LPDLQRTLRTLAGAVRKKKSFAKRLRDTLKLPLKPK